jgi:hypothetical protein
VVEQLEPGSARQVPTHPAPPRPRCPRTVSLVPSADVPRWFAELTAGRLVESDAPTLALGSISAAPAQLRWETVLEEHPGELQPHGPNGPAGPGWADLTRACDLMQWCGLLPVLGSRSRSSRTPGWD